MQAMEVNSGATIRLLKDIVLCATRNDVNFFWFDHIHREGVDFLRERGFLVEYYPHHKQWFVSWEQN